MLSSDYVLERVCGILLRVQAKALSWSRTLEKPTTDRGETTIGKILSLHLPTLQHLLTKNREDYLCAMGTHEPEEVRDQASRRLVTRRDKAVRLVEELNLRTSVIEPLQKELEELDRCMQELHTMINEREMKVSPDDSETDQTSLADLQSELHEKMLITLESPTALHRRVVDVNVCRLDYENAKSILLHPNLSLVVRYASRRLNRGLGLWDLIQLGNMGLMRAVEQFDPSLDNRFETYAKWIIKNMMERGIKSDAPTIKVPETYCDEGTRIEYVRRSLAHNLNRQPTDDELATACGLSLSVLHDLLNLNSPPQFFSRRVNRNEDTEFISILEDTRVESPETPVINANLREALFTLMSKVLGDDRNEQIVQLDFGLNPDNNSLERIDIADIFSISHTRVRQIVEAAIKKMQIPYNLKGFQKLLDSKKVHSNAKGYYCGEGGRRSARSKEVRKLKVSKCGSGKFESKNGSGKPACRQTGFPRSAISGVLIRRRRNACPLY